MENPASNGASSKGEWQASKVPPVSTLDRGMCEEKRKMNRFPIVGTLNSGGPGNLPAEVERRPRANGDQPQEDATWILRESDPPIVVREGKAGHKAKERAGWQCKQNTHYGPCRTGQNVLSSLLALETGSGKLCLNKFQMRVILGSRVR